MTTARRRLRSRSWLRALVLLLALLVPHEACPVPSAAAQAVSVECDVMEAAALPPLLRPVQRPAVPLRPAPLEPPASTGPVAPSQSLPARVPDPLRTVVLRC
ncbi:hypothetical protein ABT065_19195 [Streptomyces sp. NPDC002764]|uniref:hypothetical protein n=1 Tax=Streptomyces sp. NPDC002764 TaxID=3154428 RepID=UPI0033212B41